MVKDDERNRNGFGSRQPMRLLVISDSHGRSGTVDSIISSHPEAKHVFFLGDVVRDVESAVYEYDDRVFHIVAGNCDGFCSFPDFDILDIEGHSIYFTHGHTSYVKSGTDTLCRRAKNCGCDIVLYGHTHISDIEYKNGLYVVNPGSCSRSRNGIDTYAVIDITKEKIIPTIMEV